MGYISQIQLSHFRNYDHINIDNVDNGFVVLTGSNGAGKTNILEAISMLAPGRGMRRARMEDLQRKSPDTADTGKTGGTGKTGNIGDSAAVSDIADAGQMPMKEVASIIIPSQPSNDIARNGGADHTAARPLTQPTYWSVSAQLQNQYGPHRLGTGLDPISQKKRVIRINGQNIASQAALANFTSIFWLTPQMDSLFRDSAAERRRFLDRMIIVFDPSHTGRLARYDKAMAQRSKLLRDGKFDPSWLDGLELQMAQTGVALAATRFDFAVKLQHYMDHFIAEGFPRSNITLSGFLEDQLQKLPALELEDRFRHALGHSREADAITGGAAIGPHRSDFMLIYHDRQMPADQCSTGEQKILLTGLVLSHTKMVTQECGVAPLLLLDEVSAHLDTARRQTLFAVLSDLGGQVWFTGTEKDLFDNISARYIAVENGRVLCS